MSVKRATVRQNTKSPDAARTAKKTGRKTAPKAEAGAKRRATPARGSATESRKAKPEAPATRRPPRARAAVPAAVADAAGRRPRAPARVETRNGSCHCGAIEVSYSTAKPPARWALHACQCDFCRSHGARLAADPQGEVRFEFTLPEYLRRYRFGLRTADFLVCRACGVFVAAVLITGRGALAAVNVNTLRDLPDKLPAAKPVAHGQESAEERRARRARSWTPVVGPV